MIYKVCFQGKLNRSHDAAAVQDRQHPRAEIRNNSDERQGPCVIILIVLCTCIGELSMNKPIRNQYKVTQTKGEPKTKH